MRRGKYLASAFFLLFWAAGNLLPAATPAGEGSTVFQSESFDLVSINTAFLINMMHDLGYVQEKIPLQDARLDVVHQRFAWYKVGLASAFLYETQGNPGGEHYKPKAFASFLPVGLHAPLYSTPEWNLGLNGTFYWANYLSRASLAGSNYWEYWKHYPKLFELTAGAELSALVSFNIGYRFQWGDKPAHGLGKWNDVISHNDYSHWFAEVNIGLQSMTRTEKPRFLSYSSPFLVLENPHRETYTLHSYNNLLIPLDLSNLGRVASRDLSVSVTNSDSLNVTCNLSPAHLNELVPGAKTTLVLSLENSAMVENIRSGIFRIKVTDAKGNSADYSLLIDLQP